MLRSHCATDWPPCNDNVCSTGFVHVCVCARGCVCVCVCVFRCLLIARAAAWLRPICCVCLILHWWAVAGHRVHVPHSLSLLRCAVICMLWFVVVFLCCAVAMWLFPACCDCCCCTVPFESCRCSRASFRALWLSDCGCCASPVAL